jgi:hypothetical protein
MPSSELLAALEAPSSLPSPLLRTTYDLGSHDLRPHVLDHLRARGFTERPAPLETLHTRLPAEHGAVRGDGPNALTTEVGERPAAARGAYRRLVRDVAERVLGYDVVFERSPALRFHLPGPLPSRFRTADGDDLAHHSDTMFGDYFEQVNCWLPLTSARGSATLQVLDLPTSLEVLAAFTERLDGGVEAYHDSRRAFFGFLSHERHWRQVVLDGMRPVAAEVGELVIFDPRTIHGTAANAEAVTRVSIDFRLVPVRDYERLTPAGDEPPCVEGERAVRGDLYDERTAFEVE